MDKNALKKFAVWARNELIAKVEHKAKQYGILPETDVKTIEDICSVNDKKLNISEQKQFKALLSLIKTKGFKQTIEEVAYTWFKRFAALRFMEVNDYLPSHIRVFSNENNEFKPQIIEEAINLDSDDFPNIDIQKIIDLKQSNKIEELYKYLITLQCNALNSILPKMFQESENYAELLLPDGLLYEDSVIYKLIVDIPEEDWKDAVQIIGWLYQYYNTELKDEVFVGLKKNIKITKENIPAATQLFTPDWIVRYMVENSLGRLWLEGHSNSQLKQNWRYYLDEADQELEVKVELEKIREKYKNLKPEDIKCIDPCMGSGHILCYLFDVLFQIYEESGYKPRDAVESIIKNNLFGLDIDERAAQLAYFAVMMKARQYDKRFFLRSIQPHVYAIKESNNISNDLIEYFCDCVRDVGSKEKGNREQGTGKKGKFFANESLCSGADALKPHCREIRDERLEIRDLTTANDSPSQNRHCEPSLDGVAIQKEMNDTLSLNKVSSCSVTPQSAKADSSPQVEPLGQSTHTGVRNDNSIKEQPIAEANPLISPLSSLTSKSIDSSNNTLKTNIESLLTQMTDATEFGSLITISNIDFDLLYQRIEGLKSDNSLYQPDIMNKLLPLIEVAEILASKYDVVVTNPPYMGIGGMNPLLVDYLRKNFPNTKVDLFSAFLERGLGLANQSGYSSMVTMQNWMFSPSFEKFRKKIINEHTINYLLHMDNMVMGIAFGTAVSIIRKNKIPNYIGNYNHIKYTDIKDDKPFEFPVLINRFAQISAKKFNYIPSSPIAYWINEKLLEAYNSGIIGDKYEACVGIQTGDNNRFLKYWFEVPFNEIDFEKDEAKGYKKRWYPHPKGGAYRKWYGNYDYVVNWQNDGEEIHDYNKSKFSIKKYNRNGICWSHTTNGAFSARVFYKTSIPNLENPILFCEGKEQKYLLALLNSKVADYLLNMINSTMHYHVGDLLHLPLLIAEDTNKIEAISDECIELARDDWDSYEFSWNFKRHPLVMFKTGNGKLKNEELDCHADKSARNDDSVINSLLKGSIVDAYESCQKKSNNRYKKLVSNEEYLNKVFINLYGVQNELTSKLKEKYVTARKPDLQRDIKSFLSYAVGCMFGRYSLDCDGLAFAGGDWDNSKYLSFIPEPTNIIPINNNQYFSNDIISKLEEFLTVLYGKDSLENNLSFIAKALPGKGTSRQIIKNYFLNSFYKDHCRIYQKRPIYWLFDSGKKNGFKCLIYMHRYQADTISRIRTDYVHPMQAKYRLLIDDYKRQIENSNGTNKIKLSKNIKLLQDQAEELRLYEAKIHHLADSMINIDLNDGIKHNYALFESVLAKIKK